MIFNLLVGMCLAYEIHKMIDFWNFSRINYIIYHYTDQIKIRKGDVYNAIIRISLTNLAYTIIVIIGIFGNQMLFFGSLMGLSVMTGSVLKKTTRKMSFIIYLVDTIISIFILIFILVNFYFFKMGSIEFVKYLITLI